MTDDELVALERAGWEALSTPRGPEHYREQLSPDALMAFPFGVLDREQALAAMAAAPPWSRWEMTDPRVVRLGQDAAVVVYSATAERAGSPPYAAVISSTFVRGPSGWRLAFHQQSPVG